MPGNISADAEIADSAHSRLGSCARERDPGAHHSSDHARFADRLLHKSHCIFGVKSTGRLQECARFNLCDRRFYYSRRDHSRDFLILFFQRGRPNSRNFRNLLFTVPVWGLDGLLVDLLYRSEAAWFGDVATLPVVCAKICVDQFGYNPFFAAPFGVLTYEWKNNGISLGPLRHLFTIAHYRDKILPTLLATWAVWIPLMAIIYSLPLALQFPLFGLALSFWVLLLTYMTNRFAGKIEADAPFALATAD